MSRANFRSLKHEGRHLKVRGRRGRIARASGAGMALGTPLTGTGLISGGTLRCPCRFGRASEGR